MSYFFIKSLAKALEPSRIAAALFGPKTLISSFSNRSTIPSTKKASGPTKTRSILFSLQKLGSFPISQAIHLPNFATPGFSPCIKISWPSLYNLSEMACSLPPFPTTSTLAILMFKVAHASKNHGYAIFITSFN